MAVRPIRVFGDPVLKSVSAPIGAIDDGVRALVRDLVDTVELPGRAGVAAPQIGVGLRAFSYNVPNLEKQSKLIEDASSRMVKVLKSIFEDENFATEINGKDNCNLCKGDHYKEYVAFEILNTALARVLQSEEYAIMIGGKKQPKK